MDEILKVARTFFVNCNFFDTAKINAIFVFSKRKLLLNVK